MEEFIWHTYNKVNEVSRFEGKATPKGEHVPLSRRRGDSVFSNNKQITTLKYYNYD